MRLFSTEKREIIAPKNLSVKSTTEPIKKRESPPLKMVGNQTNKAVKEDGDQELIEKVRQQINEAILKVPNLLDRKDTKEGQAEIRRIISHEFRNAPDIPYRLKRESEKYVEFFFDDICGLGPIQSLLRDPAITEIKVNGPYIIRVEEKGVERTVEGLQFRDRDHLMDIIQRIVAPIGRKVNWSSPIEDAFLADGSRVNIVIDPVAITGPYVTIRKFVPQLTIDELCKKGAFGVDGEKIIPVLKMAAEGYLNTVVSGGTSGGKTSLLNAIARFIPQTDSIVTIEDVRELDLHHPDVRGLLTRPANMEGKGEITQEYLLETVLRMTPKRIVIGEVRKGSVLLTALSAMNTGHPGSMFTIHANSPMELPERVELMTEKSRDTVLSAFGKTIHIIFQVNQLPDGRRRMTHIAQVFGYKNGEVLIENLFEYNEQEDRLIRTEIPFRYEGILRAKKVEIPAIMTNDQVIA